MNIGVLALQGDFREHLKSSIECGHTAIEVRRVSELDECDALILPGGESTAIALLAKNYGLIDPIRTRIASGMPTYGSCAGMILLADRIVDGIEGQITFGGLDVTVRRNAFGRQLIPLNQNWILQGQNSTPFSFAHHGLSRLANPLMSSVQCRLQMGRAIQWRFGRATY